MTILSLYWESYQSSKLAGSPKTKVSEISFWTSERILVLVRSDL